MNRHTRSKLGPATTWALAALGGLTLACATAQTASRQRVPDKPTLKARVAELYRAQLAEDEPAKRALVLPQIINCGLIISEDDDGIQHDEPPLQIIAWKIRNIEFDMNSYDSVHELCPGQPVHATAGATVTIQQTEREDGE